MARLTASDMIDMVRDSLGGETSETISDTRILWFLNQSYLEVASSYSFDQLSTSTTITTSSGTAQYELSVDTVLQIENIVDDTNNFKLYTMNEDQYHQFSQGNASSGVPIYWYVDGVGSNNRWNIRFWPTPAGTYTMNVYFKKKPTQLTATPNATSTVTPEQWDDSIIYRAIARGWAMLGDLDASRKFRQLAQANDKAAYNTTYHPSELPDPVQSRVSRALRDV